MKAAEWFIRGDLVGDTDIYYRSTLLPNRKRFLAYVRKKRRFDTNVPISGRGDAAHCLGFPNADIGNHPFAEIVLYVGEHDAITILHESVHAAVELFRRLGFDPRDDKNEEQFVRCTEAITVSVINWINETECQSGYGNIVLAKDM